MLWPSLGDCFSARMFNRVKNLFAKKQKGSASIGATIALLGFIFLMTSLYSILSFCRVRAFEERPTEGEMAHTLERLMEQNKRQGETDNMTVIAVFAEGTVKEKLLKK